jgi:hypothetical protein
MNLTSIIAVIEVLVGVVGIAFPTLGISAVGATSLIALGLSTLGISQKVSNTQVVGGKGIW